MKALMFKANVLVQEFIIMRMVINMWGISKMGCRKVKVLLHGQTVLFMKVNGKKINVMDAVSILGVMVIFMIKICLCAAAGISQGFDSRARQPVFRITLKAFFHYFPLARVVLLLCCFHVALLPLYLRPFVYD